MALTETTRPEPIDASLMKGCMALSAEAGWNQLPDDWSLFIQHGKVFGLFSEDGQPIATGATMPYSGGFAWISMVLVARSHQRQGLGTRILEQCIEEVRSKGLVPVLDATPAGEAVYRPLGFEPQFRLSRWQGRGGAAGQLRRGMRPLQAHDLPALIASDALSFGAERAFLLNSLYKRAPRLALAMDDGTGFVLARPGRVATQLGPVIAQTKEQARDLLEAALDLVEGPAFIDVVDGCSILALALQERDFSIQRPFLRMAQNRSTPFGDPRRLFTAVGPEFG
jgi:predicted GNAT family acetyltransferase